MNDLTYSQITFKASHNSEDRKEGITDQLSYNPEIPYDNGCLGVEFDIQRNRSNYIPYQMISRESFMVGHDKNEATETLACYLEQLLGWHYQNPNHDVILISLDQKNDGEEYNAYQDEIDTYLKLYFREDLIFKPKQLIRDKSISLCENVIKYDWPKLNSVELKSKFIFCLTGNKAWKAEYADTNTINRTCFSDQDQSASSTSVTPPDKGNFVFFNFHIYHDKRDKWMQTIPPFTEKHLITRTFIADSKDNWGDCITADVSAIATNKIRNHEWAKVSSDGLYKVKNMLVPVL